MSTQVKFIDTTYVKAVTTIEKNVDDTKITPFIIAAQDTHIQQALGTTMYNRLKQGVINNDLNNDELTLLREYIKPALAQFTYYEVYPFLAIKSTNKGASKERSEYADPAELSELKYMRNAIRDLAEFYLRRLTKHLCDFRHLYPQFNNPDAKENVKSNSKAYFSGMYMQKRRSDEVFKNIGTFYGGERDNCC
jgi:hypothetical protein